MAYITGLSSVVKGNRQEIYFDKGAFIFATDFTTDTYFSNDLNWDKVALHFVAPSGSQKKVIVLKDDHGRGWFAPSSTSRTGDWVLDKIQIFDKDNDFFEVQKSDIPDAASIVAKVVRVIAPASSVVSFANIAPAFIQANYSAGNSLTWTGSSVVIPRGYHIKTTTSVSFPKAGQYEVVLSASEKLSFDLRVSANVLVKTTILPGIKSVITVNQAGSYDVVLSNWDTDVSEDVTMTGLSIKESAPAGAIRLNSGEGSYWKIGYKVKIWNSTDNAFLDSTVYTITAINGDDVSLDKEITTSYVGKSIMLRFPSYAECSPEQAGKYQFVGIGF